MLTGSVKFRDLPSSGTWIINPGGYAGTRLETTISSLTAGTYNFTVGIAGSFTSSASLNVIINPLPHLVNLNEVSCSDTLTIKDRVECDADYSPRNSVNSIADVDASFCYLNGKAIVTFNSGHTLKASKKLLFLIY